MKIIDMNVTIGAKDSKGNFVTPNSLLEMMKNYNIDRVVAYHALAKFEHGSGNALMSKIAKESGEKIGMCAVLDPVLEEKSLEGTGTLSQRLRACGAEAVRIFPSELRVAFHPFYLGNIFDSANELGLPLIIDEDFAHSSTVPEIFYHLPDIAKLYPKIKFIITRYGICNSRHIIPLATKLENVYFTVDKMLDHMQIEEICEKGAENKLLFSCCYPETTPAGALGLTLYANITDAQKKKILSENWEEIRYVNK